MRALAFDTETRGLDWFRPEQRAFLVTWATAEGEWYADLSDEAGVRKFLEAVEAVDTIVCHNAKFDLHHIREAIGLDLSDKVIHDTDLMSRVMFPEGQRKGERGGHGLKNLATVYLRVDAADPEVAIKEMAKNIGLRTIKQTGAYYEVYRAYPDEMIRYAVADARYTYDLYTKFSAKIQKDAPAQRVYEMEQRVLPILTRAEQVGVAVDQDRVQEFKRQFTEQRNELHASLASELGEEALGGEGSDAALKEALLKHGIPLTEKTPTGELSTNKFALQEFEAGFPLIADLFEFRRLEKFLSTYIGPMDGVDVIHPSFRQIGAWTGRMSCVSPNLQNWPKRAGKELRSVLVPRPHHAFVVCDYEGIESRLLAYYLGDQDYREIVATRDPHAWLAAQIWGGEVEDYVKGSDKAISHRQPAKNITFAITYGAGKRRVASMLRDAGLPSTEEDARRLISQIKGSLPNYYHLTKHRIEPKIKRLGYVNTIVGRKNPVGKDKSYVGLNALIQGSAADIFKLGTINTARAVAPLGGTPLLFVHDELVTECPIERADECLAAQEEAMVAAWDLNPTLAVEGSWVTTSYADA